MQLGYRLAVGATLCALTAVLAAGAWANHPNTICAGAYNYNVSNNQTVWPFAVYNINWSDWFADLDYIGKRKDLAGNITFSSWSPGTYYMQTVTPDGLDRHLTTGIQRAGYSTATYDMEQWSHGNCT